MDNFERYITFSTRFSVFVIILPLQRSTESVSLEKQNGNLKICNFVMCLTHNVVPHDFH